MFISYVFLDVGYVAPTVTGTFSVQEINEAAKQAIGYEIFGYWPLFESADSAELMDRDVRCLKSRLEQLLRSDIQAKSIDSLCYTEDPMTLKQHLALTGAARAWLEEGKSAPIGSYVSAEEIEIHDKIFAPGSGGYGPPLNWYKAQIANLNTPDEANIPPERNRILAPTLLVTCTLDYVRMPSNPTAFLC